MGSDTNHMPLNPSVNLGNSSRASMIPLKPNCQKYLTFLLFLLTCVIIAWIWHRTYTRIFWATFCNIFFAFFVNLCLWATSIIRNVRERSSTVVISDVTPDINCQNACVWTCVRFALTENRALSLYIFDTFIVFVSRNEGILYTPMKGYCIHQ